VSASNTLADIKQSNTKEATPVVNDQLLRELFTGMDSAEL
jgi:hypothetical protein